MADNKKNPNNPQSELFQKINEIIFGPNCKLAHSNESKDSKNGT